MSSRACDSPGCSASATLRQLEPKDPALPRYLCVRHWSELRILNADGALRFGSIQILGLLEEDEGEEEGDLVRG
jgi:hypothetical protein